MYLDIKSITVSDVDPVDPAECVYAEHIFSTQTTLEDIEYNLYTKFNNYDFDKKIKLIKELMKQELLSMVSDVDTITNLEIMNRVSDYWVLSYLFFDNSQSSDSDNFTKYKEYQSKYRDLLTKRMDLIESSESVSSYVISSGKIVRWAKKKLK